MRGSRNIKRHQLIPDRRFRNVLVSQFINYVMLDGKKSIAEKIVYGAFDRASNNLKKDHLEIFDQAIKNASPILEVKGRRVGGANYQIPFEVTRSRRQTLAMKWMIKAARDKQGKPMEEFLATEIIDSYHNQGAAVKKKDEMHRMAEANKAFAHFARFS